MSLTSMLNKPVFCSTSIADLLKLIVPIGWSALSLCAVLAYLLSPLKRGESPRWYTSSIILVQCLSGIGLSTATYSFHLSKSSVSTDWDEQQRESRGKSLRIHLAFSIFLSLITFSLTLFFAAFAPGMNRCAHATCGADIGWSAIGLILAIFWFFITILGIKELSLACDFDDNENGSSKKNDGNFDDDNVEMA